MTNQPREFSRFDRDPEALAWARTKVQAEIDRADKFVQQATADGATESAEFWRRHALHLHRSFIGGEGCAIACFDERRPAFVKSIDNAATDVTVTITHVPDPPELQREIARLRREWPGGRR